MLPIYSLVEKISELTFGVATAGPCAGKKGGVCFDMLVGGMWAQYWPSAWTVSECFTSDSQGLLPHGLQEVAS